MKPEGSLRHSQQPATCPYPEPDRSSPYPASLFLKIHLNIILLFTPGTPNGSPSLRFPHLNSVCASHLPHTRYMLHPSHSSRFDHSNNIGWRVQFIKLLNLHSPITSSLLGPNILLNTLFSNTLSLRSSLNVSDQVSHSNLNKQNIVQENEDVRHCSSY